MYIPLGYGRKSTETLKNNQNVKRCAGLLSIDQGTIFLFVLFCLLLLLIFLLF